VKDLAPGISYQILRYAQDDTHQSHITNKMKTSGYI